MNCENCGRPLTSAYAECRHCALERRGIPTFSYDPAVVPVPDAGAYACPACGKHFDKCKSVLVPEKAPWWRFQKPGLACPHCDTRLRWERRRRSSHLRLLLQAVAIASCCVLLSGKAEAAESLFPGHAVWLSVGNIGVFIYLVFAGEHALLPYEGDGHFVEAWTERPKAPNRFWSIGIFELLLSVQLMLPSAWMMYYWVMVLVLGVAAVVGFVSTK